MKTVEDSRARMTPQTPSPERPYVEDYVILLKPKASSGSIKPEFIGMVGTIREISVEKFDIKSAPEWGYMIDVKYQKQGYATEAGRGFLELYWSLERRKAIDLLVAVVDEENSGSVNVIKKVGAELMGKKADDYGSIWVLKRPAAK
jgi:RimJ/RimL family protein N-acetyltransferase